METHVQDPSDNSNVTVPEQIDEVRNQLLDKSLVVLAVLALPVVIVSLFRAQSTGWQPIMYLHIFIGILIPVSIILRRRLTLRVRIAIIFGSLLFMGIVGLLTYGLIGAGILILTTVCLTFTIVFGLRSGMIVFIASIITIVTTGIGVHLGIITYAFDFNVYAIAASSWITTAATFVIFVGFLVVISGLFNQYLNEAITVVNKRSNQLQQINKELIEEFKAHQLADDKLEKSEEKLSRAFQATPDAVGITRLSDGMILYANRAFAKYAKFPLEETIGKSTLDLNMWVNPEDRIKLMKRLQDVGEVRDYEIELRAVDEGTLPMSMSASLMEIDGEKCMVSLTRDITERKQAEEALYESENKYKTLFEQSADAILIIEGEKFVDCNLATVKMLGYENKKELLETHPSELSPEIQPDGRNSFEKANEILSTVYEQGSIRFEWDHKRQNGEVFPVEVLMTAVPIGERKFLHVVWRDITERKKAEEELLESNERFKAAFADAAIGMTLVSLDHAIIEANQAYCNMLGYSKDELVGTLLTDITHPDDLDTSSDHHLKLITGELDNYNFEKRYIHKQGHDIWGHLNVSLVRDNTGTPLYSVAQIQDITSRKKVEFDLANRTNQLIQNQKALWELANEEFNNQISAFNRIVKTDAEQLNVERVSVWLFNEAHTEIVCKALYQGGEINNEELILSADQYPAYFQALAENGFIMANDACNDPDTNEFTEGYLIPLGITSMMDIPIHSQGEMIGVVCHEHIGPIREWSVEDEDFAKSIADMCALALAASESKQAKQNLSYQASHDTLTGLVNRREFERRAEQLLSTIRQENSEHALCFMDLDQFKIVNDTCGHTAGDELLRQLSVVLQNTVRHSDTLARLGGDEFGVLMEHCSLDDAHRVATSLQKAIQEFQFSWEGKMIKIGVSIGLVPITDDLVSLTELLIHADAACYMAKDQGRNRIHVYHDEDLELAQRHGEMQWASRLNHALEEDRLCLFAQSIVPLDGSTDDHYELLIRMIDEEGKIVPPGSFLPAAERYNLIAKIDNWVIKNSFRLLAENPEFLNKIHFCSINLSGQSITENEFLNFVIDQLDKVGLPGEKICFEITETAAISNLSKAIKFISTMKGFGCLFALDDFGSGLSSFGYLKNLPVDYLKIDGMFVKNIVDDPIDHAMVKSINDIGHVMGMQTIAEFVENETIKNMLKEIGVNYGQGYGIGKPISFDTLLRPPNDTHDNTATI